MIVFRHYVSNFGNILLECSGLVPASGQGETLNCSSASVLIAALVAALRKIDKPSLRLSVDERIDSAHPFGFVSVRCKYTPETASMAQVTLSGFEWLSDKSPDAVRIERVTGRTFSEHGKKPPSC